MEFVVNKRYAEASAAHQATQGNIYRSSSLQIVVAKCDFEWARQQVRFIKEIGGLPRKQDPSFNQELEAKWANGFATLWWGLSVIHIFI